MCRNSKSVAKKVAIFKNKVILQKVLHSVSYCDNILSEQKDKCPPYKDKSGNLFLKKEKGERT